MCYDNYTHPLPTFMANFLNKLSPLPRGAHEACLLQFYDLAVRLGVAHVLLELRGVAALH